MDKQTEEALDRGISAYRAHYRKIEDAMPEQIRALAMVLQNIALTGRHDEERLSGPVDEARDRALREIGAK